MSVVTAALAMRGRELSFHFPDSGNMQAHLASILAGKDYPLLPLPSDYACETIVDIGANVGAAALWFLGAAPDARIVCFEPSRENHDCLRHNLASFPRAEAHHCGLYSRAREASLHLGASQCMQHSIVASGETGGASETITLKRASTEFDRLGLERISILKIDTEGCELAILQDLGAARLAKIDMIYLEWHSDEDRRAIDALLGERFLLAHASAKFPHRGNAAYMAASLAARVPAIAAARIARPAD
jgi:FkbM family methyltransferase